MPATAGKMPALPTACLLPRDALRFQRFSVSVFQLFSFSAFQALSVSDWLKQPAVRLLSTSRMARSDQNRMLDEVLGLILLGTGTLLFLALISYNPRDLPDWFPLSYITPPNRPAQNFIGPVGAIVASCFYFLFGAASHLFTALMLGYGGAKLLTGSLRLTPRSFWVVGFILSGACIAHLQPWFLEDWPRAMNIRGAGGWLGYWLGERIFRNSLGVIGSAILLTGVYVTSLILMTGLQPVRLVRSAVLGYHKWRADRQAARLARASERERLDIEQRRIENEAKKLSKKLKRQGVKPAESEEPAPADDFADRPTPQVIDTSAPAPRPTEPKKLAVAAQPHFEGYQLPDLDLLDETDAEGRVMADPEELRAIQNTVIETLAQFGIAVSAGDITKGPTITRYEVYPAKGVRVDKIVSLERDIARATRAERINILAPIPGKDTVGIEIANTRKVKVTLRELLESDDFQNTKAKIPIALGKDVYGKTIIADLAAMPHGLVAGTTGSGKSVCINAIVASLLYRFTPDQLRLIMIDPKVVEMQMFNVLPHLVVPVVTDPKKVLLALRWAIDEMEKRYAIFAKTNVRNIDSFNARPLPKSQRQLDAEKEAARAAAPEAEPEPIDFGEMSDEELLNPKPKITVPRDAEELIIPDRLPYIVIIVDELADLMQTAPADVELAIARITQKARAAGLHMIIATQTPRADVITGVIKANVPCRIAFQVASPLDSRVILDENGAERLLGQGDMLYRPPGTSRMTRAQGVLVTDDEIRRIVDFAAAQVEPSFVPDIHERLAGSTAADEEISEEDEELVQKCIEVMRQEKKASTSLFQRRLKIGYSRSARVVDILEQRGYVAPGEGAKPREILKDLDALVG
jgi:S-DNA-T family DNA segregation ATPase FtsK/SpoIIIE